MDEILVVVRSFGEYSDRVVTNLCWLPLSERARAEKFCRKMPMLLVALNRAYERVEFDDAKIDRRDQLHRRAHRLDPYFADREYGEGEGFPIFGCSIRYYVDTVKIGGRR